MDKDNIFGILPVYKDNDMTSFDVIGKLRKILHIKRLGHGGTLDPMATGVLPVFAGKATKCCDIVPDKRKVYKAGFKFGLSTDTEDITGKVLEKCDAKVSEDEILKKIPCFVGKIMQIPPMYSAVKVDGKKLYQLAREGKTVERTPREIKVNSIEITAFDEISQSGEMIIDCMKGTYVRTIISDLGKSLETYGVMTSLERTYSGGISIEECVTLEEIERLAEENKLEEIIIPTYRVFECYDKIALDERTTALYKNGVKLRAQQVKKIPNDEEIYRVYGFDGTFLGIGKFCDEMFRSVKNFY